MENIDSLRFRLALMLSDERKRKKQKPSKAELYMKDRADGMTCVAVAKKYGVTHQAVSKACRRYRRRMEQEAEDGKCKTD